MATCQSSNCLNLLNKTDSSSFDKLLLSRLTQGKVIHLKRKPQNIAIDSSFETEKFSTLRGMISILLRVVLLHSQGRGCLFETAMPTFMTKFRSYFMGLSNGVSFVSLSYVVPEKQLKTFFWKLPERRYMSASVPPLGKLSNFKGYQNIVQYC